MMQDYQQVLKLTLHYVTDPATLFRCNLVSTKFHKQLPTVIERRLPSLLPMFLANAPRCQTRRTFAAPSLGFCHVSVEPCGKDCIHKHQMVEWLCSTGRAGMGRPATAAAVLGMGVAKELYHQVPPGLLLLLANTGLQLSDQLVIEAAHQGCLGLAEFVAGLLKVAASDGNDACERVTAPIISTVKLVTILNKGHRDPFSDPNPYRPGRGAARYAWQNIPDDNEDEVTTQLWSVVKAEATALPSVLTLLCTGRLEDPDLFDSLLQSYSKSSTTDAPTMSDVSIRTAAEPHGAPYNTRSAARQAAAGTLAPRPTWANMVRHGASGASGTRPAMEAPTTHQPQLPYWNLIKLAAFSGHDQYIGSLVKYVNQLPTKPDPKFHTWLQQEAIKLLQSKPEPRMYFAAPPQNGPLNIVAALAKLQGIDMIPTSVFGGLVLSLTPWSQAVDLALQLPQAQCMEAHVFYGLAKKHLHSFRSSFIGEGAQHVMGRLLELPAASQIQEDHAYDLFSTALAYDALHADKDLESRQQCMYSPPRGPSWDASEALQRCCTSHGHSAVYAIRSLACRMTSSQVAALLRLSLQQRWLHGAARLLGQDFVAQHFRQGHFCAEFAQGAADAGLLDHLEPVFLTSPALSAVLPELSTADAFTLLHGLLSGTGAQARHISHACAAVPACADIPAPQLATLLQQAFRTGQIYNVGFLCTLPAATDIDPQVVLQLCRRAVQGSVSYATVEGNTRSQQDFLEALQGLVVLPASTSFTKSNIQGLVEIAVDGTSLDTFCLLCQHLQVDITQVMSVLNFKPLLQQGILSHNHTGVRTLLQHPLAQSLSADDLQEAISEAMSQSASTSGLSFKVWDGSDGSHERQEAAYAQAVLILLLGLPQLQHLSVDHITALLRRSLQLRSHLTFKALLGTFAAARLGQPAMEVLLLDAVQMVTARITHKVVQGAYRGDHSPVGSFYVEMLLANSAAQRLDSAAVCRLIAAAAGNSMAQFGADTNDLVMCFLKLPAVQVMDASALCEAMAAVMGASMQPAIKALFGVPAVALLSAGQIRGLLQAACRHRDKVTFDRLLQHPRAPGRDNLEVQLLARVLPAPQA